MFSTSATLPLPFLLPRAIRHFIHPLAPTRIRRVLSDDPVSPFSVSAEGGAREGTRGASTGRAENVEEMSAVPSGASRNPPTALRSSAGDEREVKQRRSFRASGFVVASEGRLPRETGSIDSSTVTADRQTCRLRNTGKIAEGAKRERRSGRSRAHADRAGLVAFRRVEGRDSRVKNRPSVGKRETFAGAKSPLRDYA